MEKYNKQDLRLSLHNMKRIIVFSVLSSLLTSISYSQEQPKNIFGISAGFVPAIGDMYFDVPFDMRPNREAGVLYQIFYARQLGESFRGGSYYEYEQARFSVSDTGNIYGFDRYNIGFNWLVQYPKTILHMQLGGFVGYGFLKAQNWDRPSGFDLGMIAGPAYEMKNLGVALHIQTGHAWYKSSGSPSGVMLYTPRFLLKVYYRFKPTKFE
jgi:hypothetical protein